MPNSPDLAKYSHFALLSVSDKTGITDFARALNRAGLGLVSTGGTARHLRDAGLEVINVSDLTAFEEILDGRVKTLHPRIHAALLADRTNAGHRAVLEQLQIADIRVVVVNLYPFTRVVGADTPWDEAIENIDIGGPTMLRAAAKNHRSVTVVVDPADFTRVEAMLASAGAAGGAQGSAEATAALQLRQELALKAFEHTASYDAAIVRYFEGKIRPASPAQAEAAGLSLSLERTATLRYGENPHQRAALYHGKDALPYGGIEQLHGKELSYNNIVDLDAALELVWEFAEPAAAIIKHTNPAGCAVATTLDEAYEHALATDPTSAFGGIVALNAPVDATLASRLHAHFYEIVAAPAFDEDALAILRQKKNLRLMRWKHPSTHTATLRVTALGYLAQDVDPRITLEAGELEIPTARRPDAEELRSLLFAWKVCKHVKSNAIVLAHGTRTLGVGAGQMSRVDSVELAARKYQRDEALATPGGLTLASDAFFPFRDGVDVAASVGVRTIIQPGGSVRDAEVIAACDEHGIAMVFTGKRHFRH